MDKDLKEVTELMKQMILTNCGTISELGTYDTWFLDDSSDLVFAKVKPCGCLLRGSEYSIKIPELLFTLSSSSRYRVIDEAINELATTPEGLSLLVGTKYKYLELGCEECSNEDGLETFELEDPEPIPTERTSFSEKFKNYYSPGGFLKNIRSENNSENH